jgi:hypothetical protein
MNIDEVKEVVDRIVSKKQAVSRFQELKDFIDNRTNPAGLVTITIEKETFDADPVEVKKLLNKRIQDNDTTDDEIELKNKAK